jgi:hypothetical protein
MIIQHLSGQFLHHFNVKISGEDSYRRINSPELRGIVDAQIPGTLITLKSGITGEKQEREFKPQRRTKAWFSRVLFAQAGG